ncbi:MAG: DNA methyltransferase [Patescibacteria group bacterium]
MSYYTHGLFKYPCKFIPHIPKWAISKYSKEGDLILDPFVGSGTTAVEAVLNNRDSIGVDFDYLSKLLSQVKTGEIHKAREIQSIGNFLEYIENESFVERVDELKLPSIKNLNHWFSQKTIYDLYNLKVKLKPMQIRTPKN